MHMRTTRATVDGFLQASVSGQPGDMADFYADHVVIEMPFAVASLYPSRIETSREQLRERFAAGAATRRYTHVGSVVIHETADPEVAIVEYELHGEMVATNQPFALSFVLVMTVRDGYIVHSRDYTDPIVGARLLDRVPDLIAALNQWTGLST
jgi:ketosteroid isomerase-like protein